MSVEAASGSPSAGSREPAPGRHGESNGAVGRLAAGIAHELRNPLAVILARAQLLALALRNGQVIEPDKLRRTLATIEEQALRASRVIENVSLFARPRPPDIQDVDLRAVVTEVLQAVKSRMPEQGIVTEVDVAPDAGTVPADPAQLGTALTHLVLNAVEAMTAGGRLRVRVRREPGGVEIAVADTGPGVPPHDAPRIFEPFFSTKRSAAGLGLSVALTIAEAHGGSLRLAQRGTPGAEFVLTLPAGRAPA